MTPKELYDWAVANEVEEYELLGLYYEMDLGKTLDDFEASDLHIDSDNKQISIDFL